MITALVTALVIFIIIFLRDLDDDDWPDHGLWP